MKTNIFLLVCLVLIFLSQNTKGQSKIVRIDSVNIERFVDSENGYRHPDDRTKIETYKLTEDTIRSNDVIVFYISGIDTFLVENDIPTRNLKLLIDDIEFSNIRAYIEDASSHRVRFQISFSKLSQDIRKKLYKLEGKSTKAARIGIKINEKNVLYYSERAQIYFKELSGMGWGWLTIGCVIVAFFVIVFCFAPLVQIKVDSKYFYSYSKTQFFFWTLIVAGSYVYVALKIGHLNVINETALILLGVTSGTIGLAGFIRAISHEQKKVRNQVPRNNWERIKKFIKDILSDKNGYSITRLQAVIFNLIFAVIYFNYVLQNASLPEFTNNEFILLGLSNGTYAFLKNWENKS